MKPHVGPFTHLFYRQGQLIGYEATDVWRPSVITVAGPADLRTRWCAAEFALRGLVQQREPDRVFAIWRYLRGAWIAPLRDADLEPWFDEPDTFGVISKRRSAHGPVPPGRRRGAAKESPSWS